MMWAVFTGMAVLLALLLVSSRIITIFSVPSENAEKEKTLALYKAQLKNLDRDVDAGLIARADVRDYQLEIERRVLQAGEGQKASVRNPAKGAMTALTPFIVVLVFSGVIYLQMGHPGYYPPMRGPDPAEMKAADGGPSLNELLGELKTHLAQNPDDQEGWFRLAAVSLRIRAFQDAANAYGKAAALETENPQVAGGLYASQAEAFVFLGDGLVSPAANWAIARALEKDPDQALARYYQGLGLFQAQEPEQALVIWEKLANDMPPDTPWLASLISEIEIAKRMMGIEQ